MTITEKTVYVVEWSEYKNTYVMGVFSTRANAESFLVEFAQKHDICEDEMREAHILDLTLDERLMDYIHE